MGKPKANIDKDLFIHMYVDQKKNGLEMAVLFGVGRTTVSRYIEKWGLERRNITEVRKNKHWNGGENQRLAASEFGKTRIGAKNPAYRGGHIDKLGYKHIYVDGQLIKEHRHIVQQYLGRKLTSNEDVHHINENKLDNRIENLEVLTKSEHATKHWSNPEKRKSQSEKIKLVRSQKHWGW